MSIEIHFFQLILTNMYLRELSHQVLQGQPRRWQNRRGWSRTNPWFLSLLFYYTNICKTKTRSGQWSPHSHTWLDFEIGSKHTFRLCHFFLCWHSFHLAGNSNDNQLYCLFTVSIIPFLCLQQKQVLYSSFTLYLYSLTKAKMNCKNVLTKIWNSGDLLNKQKCQSGYRVKKCVCQCV